MIFKVRMPFPTEPTYSLFLSTTNLKIMITYTENHFCENIYFILRGNETTRYEFCFCETDTSVEYLCVL